MGEPPPGSGSLVSLSIPGDFPSVRSFSGWLWFLLLHCTKDSATLSSITLVKFSHTAHPQCVIFVTQLRQDWNLQTTMDKRFMKINMRKSTHSSIIWLKQYFSSWFFCFLGLFLPGSCHYSVDNFFFFFGWTSLCTSKSFGCWRCSWEQSGWVGLLFCFFKENLGSKQ